MKRINRLPIVKWDVEVFADGKCVKTWTSNVELATIMYMADMKVAGYGVTCIARNRRGEGSVAVLGLVFPIADAGRG